MARADDLDLHLPQNAGTGYVWSLAEHGDGLELVGEQDAAQGTVPGGAGRHEVRLRAATPGVWTLRLVCRRPWEDVAIDERRLTVVVS